MAVSKKHDAKRLAEMFSDGEWHGVRRAGGLYYKFDDETDRVMDGYPRRISQDFGPSSDSTDAVPDNLDAAWFDSVSSQLYFFKGEWVRQTVTIRLAVVLGYNAYINCMQKCSAFSIFRWAPFCNLRYNDHVVSI